MLTVRKVPSIAIPKPTPATAVPARKMAAVVVSTPERLTTVPVSRVRHPPSMATDPLTPRDTTEVTSAPTSGRFYIAKLLELTIGGRDEV